MRAIKAVRSNELEWPPRAPSTEFPGTIMSSTAPIPLPRGWAKVVRSGVLHAISVASVAMTHAWSQASSSRSSRTRERADADRLRTEVGQQLYALAVVEGLEAFLLGRVPAQH